MKKISLLVATAALCFGANAGINLQQRASVNHRPAHQHVSAMAKAKAVDGPEFTYKLISEQPEGELKSYARAGKRYGYDANYNHTILQQDGMALQVVYTHNEDEVVYILDPVASGQSYIWVEGKVEGNKIIVPAFQALADYGDYGLAICECDLVVDPNNGNINYYPSTEVTEITYTINDDESISLDMTEEEGGYPVKMLGLMYTDDYSWCGIGDWSSVYTPVTDALVEIPADVILEDYACSVPGSSFIVQCGTDGQNFYVAGLSEGPAVGTIEGNTVTFASGQYLGVKLNWLTYLMGATFEEIYDEENDAVYNDYTATPAFVMNYDAEAKVLTPAVENSAIILATAATDSETVYFTEAFVNPVIKVYVEVPGAPVTPTFTYFEDYRDYYGQYYVDFEVKNITVAGDFISPDQMEWAVYADDEVYVFSPDDGYYLSEDMEWFPYDFKDEFGGYDITCEGANHIVYLYEGLYNEIGIQSRANFGGVYYYSNINYINPETLETREEEVENDVPTAIQQVGAQKPVRSLFDLQGRRAKTAKGLTVSNGAVRFVK